MNPTYVRRGLGVLSAAAICLAAAELTARGPDMSRTAPPQDAQAKPAPPKPVIPLRITIVISRFQGEKRTASLPFTLMVNTHDRSSNMRMNADVPYPSGAGANAPSYGYRPIGTSIDCTAETTADDGRFRLQVTISDSQIFSEVPGGPPPIMRGIPSFQSFTSQSVLLLRDGQTIQYTTATDKTSAEVVKVDVTMNVAK